MAKKMRDDDIVGAKKFKPSLIAIYVVLSAWALTTIYPFIWVILNSFRVRGQIRKDSFSIPWPWVTFWKEKPDFTIDNYAKAIERLDVFSAYKNSLVIAISVTLVVLLLSGFCAYGLARYNFRGRGFLNAIVVASMMFPVFATIIPVFRMEVSWGVASTGKWGLSMISVILPQIAGNLSFAIILLLGFIRGLPIDLEEAAYIEGCNVLQVFFKVVVPICRPSFVTAAIFTFLWSYNDLFTQSFFLRFKHLTTVTKLMTETESRAGTDYGLMAAGVVMIVVPVIIVYIILQKNIIKGLTAGAIKG